MRRVRAATSADSASAARRDSLSASSDGSASGRTRCLRATSWMAVSRSSTRASSPGSSSSFCRYARSARAASSSWMRAGSNSATIPASAGSCARVLRRAGLASAASRRRSASSRSVSSSSAAVAASSSDAAWASRVCAVESPDHSSAVIGQRGQLALPRLEEIAFRRRRLRGDRGGVEALDRGAPLAPCRRGLAGEGGEAAVGVQQHPLLLRRRQGLVRMLAVQVHQRPADRRELRQRRGPAVDPGAASALRVQRPPQQQRAVVAGEPLLVQPGARRRVVDDVERRGEFRPFRAGTQLPQLEAIAQQQRQRVEQDRLAGAGFPGQRGEARPQLEVERVHDDEVANRKQAQHGRREDAALQRGAPATRNRSGVSLQCSFSRSIAKWSCPSGCSSRAG